MEILVLGGTGFLGRQLAVQAHRAGHDVTVTGRGKTGSAPEGARFVSIDRDQPDGLKPLWDKEFGAVIDVASMNYPWVATALRELNSAQWTFVSSANAYADHSKRGKNEQEPTLPPLTDPVPADAPLDPDTYGRVKVACENAVLERGGLAVRSGLITGGGDRSDRFGYWPARMSLGGAVLVPEAADQPVQHIDVRDLAEWIVAMTVAGRSGVFNGVGPSLPLGELLAGIAEHFEVELVPVGLAALEAAGVQPWAGPKSLPLLAPRGYDGFLDLDVSAAQDAGLVQRPLAETVAGALATERELGIDRERKAGLRRAEETELLARMSRG